MAARHHVFLIPGFFGFANLGQLTYFGHVRRALVEQLGTAGLEVHIHVVRTHPTASLPRRAARVLEAVARNAPRRSEPVHLIGHSTGGLDARLLVAPGVSLPTPVRVEPVAARVRTVVTVATPHHGTPLASAFATLRGQRLLQLLSLGTMHLLRFGHLPITALLRVGGLFARLDDLAVNSELLDELFGRLLEDFSSGRRRAVRALLGEVVRDQALLLQLMPEAMELFGATVALRPGVRAGSVVTRAARPSLRSRLAAGIDPAGQASRAVFGALYRLAATTPRRLAPRLTPAHERVLRRALGRVPAPADNDGIVPTRSQPWGRLLYAARADHLDVLGHFRDPEAHPPHVDWLASGSGFDRHRFDALWRAVARFVAGGRP
jgi:triacylglycerol lipase